MGHPENHHDTSVVYTMELETDGSPRDDFKYFRLPPPSTPYDLRLTLASGKRAAHLNSILFTNYPKHGSPFDRESYQQIHPVVDSHGNAHFRLPIAISGVYAFYVTFIDEDIIDDHHIHNAGSTKHGETGRFVVEPDLKIARREVGTLLSLDALSIQSTNPRWMGPVRDWGKHFANAESLGYNALHYIPVQKRGESDSPYSIADQLRLDPALFTPVKTPPASPTSLLTLGILGRIGSGNGRGKSKAAPEAITDEQQWLELEESIHVAEADHGLLAITDIVWNHTANNSPWLPHHPEAGYNLEVAPHLRPAFDLDHLLHTFDPAAYEGVPSVCEDQKDVDCIVKILRNQAIPEIKLWEYYVIDVTTSIDEFCAVIRDKSAHDVSIQGHAPGNVDIRILGGDDPKQQSTALLNHASSHTLGHRFGRKVDPHTAVAFVRALLGGKASEDDMVHKYHALLDEANLPFYKEHEEDMAIAIENIANRIAYERLDEGSPRRGPIHPKTSTLLEPYFTILTRPDRADCADHSIPLAVANNGWIWAADPLVDFAGPHSKAYLRREVIVWGDCVKLRYGKAPEDNPWLWEHICSYTKRMASLFHGFRIDNCHSTPLPVAEYLLDAARRIRPDLYILAELFTGSEAMDAVFVGRLGIHSMVREAIQPNDSFELSRLIHRHGGYPVGSLREVGETWKTGGTEGEGIIRQLRPTRPHALFYDGTHDNETPSQKRTTQDALSTAALVAFSVCAAGSTRGYDECYPRLLHVQGSAGKYSIRGNPLDVGIGRARAELNRLHVEMAKEGYREIHVHHEGEFIVIQRQLPEVRRGYLLIARTAFRGAGSNGKLDPVRLEMSSARQLLSASLNVRGGGSNALDTPTVGPDGTYASVRGISLEDPGAFRIEEVASKGEHGAKSTLIHLPENFPPGSIGIFETEMHQGEEVRMRSGLEKVTRSLTLDEINIILYRCDEEEQDVTGGGNGAYEVNGIGRLPYCGLEGWMSVLRKIILNDDLGHPLCAHLRQGTWAVAYMGERLKRYEATGDYPGLRGLREWFESVLQHIREIPSFLHPKWVSVAVVTAYRFARNRAILLLDGQGPLNGHKHTTQDASMHVGWIRGGGDDDFVEGLALTSVQLCGSVKSTGLSPSGGGPSLSAGLPHFTTHHMRCWGRDVFIAFRGLLLLTGRWEEARNHIIGFAAASRHGLIPNLLDAGRSPRFNARDATWWFIHGVIAYAEMSPEGVGILSVPISRRFYRVDGVEGTERYAEVPEGSKGHETTVAQLIQEIFEEHARGIAFCEWRAGPGLDSVMRDEGFNLEIRLDPATGFVSGGNRWNCGTWMDKMGSSEKAGNKGVPSTPRDGADIEIVGLVKEVVSWVAGKAADGAFPHAEVRLADGSALSYASWASRLQEHFLHAFYIPLSPNEDAQYQIDPALVNRRGIIKDTLGSCTPFSDYQLRPNMFVALAVAPELFTQEAAYAALDAGAKYILGPLGMRTLDPKDWAYRGDYDNANDGTDPSIAQGANYHQGPEWVWCVGPFLQAALHFGYPKRGSPAVRFVRAVLLAHRKAMQDEPYNGLPELTNSDGKYCHDSCRTQSWSSGTLLEVEYDLVKIASCD